MTRREILMDRYANIDRNILPPRITDTPEDCIKHGDSKIVTARQHIKRKNYVMAGNSFVTAIIQFKTARLCELKRINESNYASLFRLKVINELIDYATKGYRITLPYIVD
jgi:hypothetical protein